MELQYEENRIFTTDAGGKVIAWVEFPAAGNGVVDITHTVVDSSLQGQGVAGKLVAAAAERIRQTGRKTRTSCTYAKGWFEKHPEQRDLLAGE